MGRGGSKRANLVLYKLVGSSRQPVPFVANFRRKLGGFPPSMLSWRPLARSSPKMADFRPNCTGVCVSRPSRCGLYAGPQASNASPLGRRLIYFLFLLFYLFFIVVSGIYPHWVEPHPKAFSEHHHARPPDNVGRSSSRPTQKPRSDAFLPLHCGGAIIRIVTEKFFQFLRMPR